MFIHKSMFNSPLILCCITVTLFTGNLSNSLAQDNEIAEQAEEQPTEPSAAMKRYQDVWQSKNPYDNEFYASFSYQPLKGLPMEVGVSRRDASQIIKVDNTYYVYYTKVTMPNKKPAVGYEKADINTPANTWDMADIYYASSKDSIHWQEQGLAVSRGPQGGFDDRSIFTPGVLQWQGKYYLYYQAVKFPYNQRSKNVIGMSWANSPTGPWHRHGQPILTPGKSGVWQGEKPIRSLIEKEGDFDSLKVHDPYLLVFNDKIHLYYKAHPMGLSGKLKLTYPDFSGGLATADSPFGPFTKHPQNPVLNSGHEVVLWPYKSGIAALVTANGPEKNTIQWSPDGVNFEIKSHIVLPPDAAGPYVPDAYNNTKDGQGITWGISHVAQRKKQPWPHLIRFQTDLTGSKNRKFKRENIRFTNKALFNADKR